MNDEQEKVQARIHSLGQQIRAHRIAQNLSQQRLALMVHTDQAVIARIEAGKHNTGIAKYIEIADALDVPPGLPHRLLRRRTSIPDKKRAKMPHGLLRAFVACF